MTPLGAAFFMQRSHRVGRRSIDHDKALADVVHRTLDMELDDISREPLAYHESEEDHLLNFRKSLRGRPTNHATWESPSESYRPEMPINSFRMEHLQYRNDSSQLSGAWNAAANMPMSRNNPHHIYPEMMASSTSYPYSNMNIGSAKVL